MASNTPLETVIHHQTSAFSAIFAIFTELKATNKELEERVDELAKGRAMDQLKLVELDMEIKVRWQSNVLFKNGVGDVSF